VGGETKKRMKRRTGNLADTEVLGTRDMRDIIDIFAGDAVSPV